MDNFTNNSYDKRNKLFLAIVFSLSSFIMLFFIYNFLIAQVVYMSNGAIITFPGLITWINHSNLAFNILSIVCNLILFSVIIPLVVLFVLYKVIYFVFFRKYFNEFSFILYRQSKLPEKLPKVLVVFPTYNDFMPDIVRRNICQTYQNIEYYILDDSNDPDYIDMINQFVKEYPNVKVVRRTDRVGWKGGNIDHFLHSYQDDWNYYCICDADVLIQNDFIESNIALFYAGVAKIGYIQGVISAYDSGWLTSTALRPKIEIKNEFTNFLSSGSCAHNYDSGIIISRTCYDDIGNIGDNVNCDTAFLIKAFEKGYRGIYSNLSFFTSMEPKNLPEYIRRDHRWIQAQFDILTDKNFKTKIHKSNQPLRVKLYMETFLKSWINLPVVILLASILYVVGYTCQYYLYDHLNWWNREWTLFDCALVIFLCLIAFNILSELYSLIVFRKRLVYLMYLIFAKRFAQYESVMSLHTMLVCYIANLFNIHQKSFNTTNKYINGSGMNFRENFQLLFWRIMFGLGFLVIAITLLLVQIFCHIEILPIIIFFFINALPGIYCILFGWFNQIRIKSKHFLDFDLFNPFNRIREKYGFEKIK
ncbi:MAG: glycosyltransferase family 2 protein [Mycoplasmataceae bacterium]|nr:glycosyltransferase family 2 protein [Mycoplasmataceae bacterium]